MCHFDIANVLIIIKTAKTTLRLLYFFNTT